MYVANVAPVFAQSPPVGPVTVPENTTAVGAPGLFAATDADSEDEVTYSLSGADASLFNISAGTLMFKEESAPNFEIRNTLEVTVVATGGAGNRALSIMRTVTINITDVNEPPAFTSAPAGSASENAVATTFTAAAADPDADDTTAVVYSIDKTDATTGGADRDRFAIDSSTGVLTFNAGDAPDFEHPRGSPLDAVSNTNDYEVIVTASGGTGERARQSTQTVTVNVTDVNDAPVLAPIAPPAFTAGTAGAFTITATDEDIPVQTLTFTLTGSDMFGAAITAGGEFSWTPGAGDVGVERMFTVEVADSASPPLTHSQPFTITAAAQDLAFLAVGVGLQPDSMTSATIFYPTGAAITNTTWPAAIGGTGTVTYAMPDGVPRGLTFDAGTRVLSGTPAAPTAPFNVRYTATDSASPPASVSITITFATCDTGGAADGGTFCSAPTYTTLALTPPPAQTYTTDRQLAPPLTLPPATGGTSGGTAERPTRIYSIIPLPPGLIFDPATRVLSGKPSVSGSFTITYEVRDAGSPSFVDRSATTTFPITVDANTAPVFGAGVSIDAQNYLQNSPITALTLPQTTGGNAPITYTLTPAIPGLTLNPTSRVLTGTPTTAAASAQYTYTATDTDDDSVTLTFNIVVAEDKAPDFGTATAADQSFTVGETVALTLPIATGGNGAITYTLTPAIPGLTLNPNTGILTGTPTTAAASAQYTYTATDTDDDSVTLTFNIVVAEDKAPDFGTATAADQSFTVGETVALTLPVATGGNGALTYTLTPALPGGLTFDATTRTISGTASTAASAQTYTYTATDKDADTDTLTFSITVSPPDESVDLAVNAGADQTVTAGDTVTITATVTGNVSPDADLVVDWAVPPISQGGLAATVGATDAGRIIGAVNAATGLTLTLTASAADLLTADVAFNIDVTVTDPTAAAGQGPATDSITITMAPGDAPAPTSPTSITLSATPTTVTESADPTDITFTATLVGGTFDAERVVNFLTQGGTATSGTDYTAVPSTNFTIPANTASISGIVPFEALVDTVADSGETAIFVVNLLDVPQANVVFSASATITIMDAAAEAVPLAVNAGDDQTVTAGDTVTITATVAGSNSPDAGLTVVWSLPDATTLFTDAALVPATRQDEAIRLNGVVATSNTLTLTFTATAANLLRDALDVTYRITVTDPNAAARPGAGNG